MRRLAIVGQRALSSPHFLFNDIPGTSGRLDVLLRCLRASLLVSHGIRRDTIVYLVLLGDRPTTLRFDGRIAKYLRPDEHQLAKLVQKLLAFPNETSKFVELRDGISIARGGLELVMAEAPEVPRYLLDEQGTDVRSMKLSADALFVLGDDRGFAENLTGAQSIAVGPVSLMADDAIVLIHNELDRL